jgi:hypothetical protein
MRPALDVDAQQADALTDGLLIALHVWSTRQCAYRDSGPAGDATRPAIEAYRRP